MHYGASLIQLYTSLIYNGPYHVDKLNKDLSQKVQEMGYKNISEISVASGVVIDSNAKHEFNENYIKAKALMDLYK